MCPRQRRTATRCSRWNGTTFTNTYLYSKLPYNPARDFVPATGLGVIHLGLGSARRIAQFPDVPTVAETVPGYESSIWFGLFAPRATPQGIVASINSDVQKILTDRNFEEAFLRPSFYEPLLGSAEQFAHFVQSDAMKWGAVIQSAKLSVQ
jgi:tripartite-type tricarboxylate transporter receptor subunit TctC